MSGRSPNIGLVLPDFGVIPWHDDVNENFVMMDSLFFTLFGLTNVKGAWRNSTAIVTGERYFDVVVGQLFQSTTTHTSPATPTTFAQDRTANPDRWTALGSAEAISAAANAQAAATAAAASQTAAASSASAANASQTAAASSASAASSSASAAAGSASAASGSATTASTAATAAGVSQSDAATAAAAAGTAATAAEGAVASLSDDTIAVSVASISWRTPVAAIGSTETITDCNNIINSGIYYVDPSALNKPPVPVSQAVYIQHLRQYSDTYAMQIAYRDAIISGGMFLRQRQGAAWSEWRTFQPTSGQDEVALSGLSTYTFGEVGTEVVKFSLILDGVRITSTADNYLFRCQTSPGGLVSSGYQGGLFTSSGSAHSFSEYTTAFFEIARSSGELIDAEIIAERHANSNTWSARAVGKRRGARGFFAQGLVTNLANPVSGFRLTSAGAAWTAGTAFATWEA